MASLKEILSRPKFLIGFILLTAFITLILLNYYLPELMPKKNILYLVLWGTGICATLCIVPFYKIPSVIFDNEEQSPNKTVKELILKIRFRSILFNNLSVTIFFLIIIVIVIGFYLLVKPPVLDPKDTQGSLTIRIGASVLLIFLVQILFRVFKYLLRVAAFYSGKADALEYHIMHPTMPLDKLIDIFTPEKYDISDLPQPSIADSIANALKGK